MEELSLLHTHEGNCISMKQGDNINTIKGGKVKNSIICKTVVDMTLTSNLSRCQMIVN
jgi:hypothetical protein